jgi:hypothetical protein
MGPTGDWDDGAEGGPARVRAMALGAEAWLAAARNEKMNRV